MKTISTSGFLSGCALLLSMGFLSCNHPTDPGSQTSPNIITNGSFTTTRGSVINLSDPQDLPPWQVAYGTPQNGAGAGGGDKDTHGLLQMWGNISSGEAVWQNLTTPIKAGHKYRLSMWVQFFDESNPMNNNWSRVRVIAFNDSLSTYGHWQADGKNVAEVGRVLSENRSWHQVTSEWTAPNNYQNIMINVETDDNMPGWSKIDNVELKEICGCNK